MVFHICENSTDGYVKRAKSKHFEKAKAKARELAEAEVGTGFVVVANGVVYWDTVASDPGVENKWVEAAKQERRRQLQRARRKQQPKRKTKRKKTKRKKR